MAAYQREYGELCDIHFRKTYHYDIFCIQTIFHKNYETPHHGPQKLYPPPAPHFNVVLFTNVSWHFCKHKTTTLKWGRGGVKYFLPIL